MNLDRWLEKLNSIVDEEHCAESERLQRRAWNYEPVPRIPTLINSFDDMTKERFPFTDFPVVPYSSAFRDPEQMLLYELAPIYEGALLRDDKVYTVRANYGVGIIPSLFGCRIHQQADEYPWVEPLPEEKISTLMEKGVPSLDSPLYRRVVETEEFFSEKLAEYPTLSRTIHISVCDVQGPFNLLASVVGTELFLLLYDSPEMVLELLGLMTETYIAVLRAEKSRLGEEDRGGHLLQYSLIGGTRITEDSALMLSVEHYRRFVKPFNERILREFGGLILLCDRPFHLLDEILSTEGLTALNYWTESGEEQEKVYRACAEKGVALLCYGRPPKNARTGVITKKVLKCQQSE